MSGKSYPCIRIEFFEYFLTKWDEKESSHLESFRQQLPLELESDGTEIFPIVLGAFCLVAFGFILGKYGLGKRNRIKNLSVQERKILELLQRGATNKEISDQFNIGVNTVKSHVSSILTKMNLKSRKDILNTKVNEISDINIL